MLDVAVKWTYEPVERYERLILVLYKNDEVLGSIALHKEEDKQQWLDWLKDLKITLRTEI